MKATGIFTAAVAAVALLGSAVVYNSNGSASARNAEIDRIIGEGKFNAVYPIAQSDAVEHNRQYVARVTKVVDLLQSRDVSDMPQALREARALSLKRLLEYRDRGVFPVNYDHPDQFLPCFIDRDGAICAAGYLIEQSAGRDFAEEINREYKYATIHQMSSPKLERWIASSGFTKAEIATIQGPSPRGTDISANIQTLVATPDTVLPSRGVRRSRRADISEESTPVATTPVQVAPTFELTAPEALPSTTPAPPPASDATIGMLDNEIDQPRYASRIVRGR